MTSGKLIVIPNICLHEASADDCDLLFQWRNLPEIVNLSSSKAKVSRSEHERWFKNALQNPNFHIFIILENEIPIGQVRFELIQTTEAEISIYLLPGKSGRGIGVAVIQSACRYVFMEFSILKVIANIRSNNLNSISAFTKCGFSHEQSSATNNDHIKMVLNQIDNHTPKSNE